MSLLGTVCSMKPEYQDLDGQALLDVKQSAGSDPLGIEVKIGDEDKQVSALG